MSLWTMTDEAAGKPKNLSDDAKAVTFGVDATEAALAANAAKGINTPGWVKYTTYTDAQGTTRHKSEVLVAAGSMGSDGTDTLDNDLGGGGGGGGSAVTFTRGVDWVWSEESGGTVLSYSGMTQTFINAGAPWANSASEALAMSQPIGTVYTVTTSDNETGTITTNTLWSGGGGFQSATGVGAGGISTSNYTITSISFTPA